MKKTIRTLLAMMTATIIVSAIPLAAQAQCTGGACSIVGGSLRFNPGNGGQIPRTIGSTSPATILGPTGQINSTMTASGNNQLRVNTIAVGSTAPRSIMIPAGEVAFSRTPGRPIVTPAHLVDANLLQVAVRQHVIWPNSTTPAAGAQFSAGGRAGPATVTWCPGAPLPTATHSPCLGSQTLPLTGSEPGGPTLWNGLLRYTATGAMFSGNGRMGYGANDNSGSVIARTPMGPLPPFTGAAVRIPLTVGAGDFIDPGFGWETTTTTRAPADIISGMFNASGILTNVPIVLLPSAAPGLSQQKMNGPWTTGQVVMVAGDVSPPEMFSLTGSDQRTANGQGWVSMVSGGIVNRPGTTGASTVRGLVSMQLGPVPEPGLGMGLLAGIGVLSALGRRTR